MSDQRWISLMIDHWSMVQNQRKDTLTRTTAKLLVKEIYVVPIFFLPCQKRIDNFEK